MGWHPVVLPLVGLLAAGCAVSTAELRDSLDLNQASFQDKLAGRQVIIEFWVLTLEGKPIVVEARQEGNPGDAIIQELDKVRESLTFGHRQ